MARSVPLSGRNLSLRIASTAVMVPLAVGTAVLGGIWFGAWIALAAAAGIAEWITLTGGPAMRAEMTASALAVLAAVVGLLVGGIGWGAGILAAATVLALLWSTLRPGRRWIWVAIPYLGIASLAMVWLREAEGDGLARVLWLFLVVWATDVGGYVFGRLIGGPRLVPRISPKKTWAGALGGLALAAIAGFAASAALSIGTGMAAAAAAIVLSIAAQCGDIAESAWKRHHGAKDSGTMIPGHGGVLDRLDGLLVAAPLFALACAAGLLGGGW